MELYVLCAMAIAYFITFVTTNKRVHKKIWTAAFIISFFIMGITTLLLKSSHHKGMSILALDEFYVLYINCIVTFLLGVINLWLYKVQLYNLFIKKDSEDVL